MCYETGYDHVHVYLYYALGTDVNTPEGRMKARTMLILCCIDLLAQALMLNMKRYNGKFACALCEDPGIPRASCHMHRNWPFTSRLDLTLLGRVTNNYWILEPKLYVV